MGIRLFPYANIVLACWFSWLVLAFIGSASWYRCSTGTRYEDRHPGSGHCCPSTRCTNMPSP